MTDSPTDAGSRFVVDLGSVRLPALTEKEVETRIRGVVLEALATTDFAARARLSPDIFGQFPGRTLGLWLDPDRQIPWPALPGPEDHTIIMDAFMTHPFQVLRNLCVTKGDPPPSGGDVMAAMLDVDEIDPFVRERVALVRETYLQIEPELTKPSADQRRVVAYVERLIGGQSLSEQVRRLRSPAPVTETARTKPPAPPDIIQEILDWIARMLEHGAATIYAADHPFYRTLRSGTTVARERDTVDGIKDADALGATGGGFAGTVIPGVGTAAGAAAGGAGASLGYGIAALVDWLF